ncbi:MAG: M23 family metallopeptidase [Muribaculaceae bacterium]|nr:M23 family metallopeptidase [Muribaculaceae bacterium]
MMRRKLYIYNPETDNFERFYPTLRSRIGKGLLFALSSLAAGGLIYLTVFYGLAAPTERNLREENSRLKSQYGLLQKRIDDALKVMGDISERDDNFYRVIMQMEPMTTGQRFAGLDNDTRYKELRSLGDADLAVSLSRGVDLLERQIYNQSLSFDRIIDEAHAQKDKLVHIPSVLPLSDGFYSFACGYGYRKDPAFGATRFHEGVDLAAKEGTPVYATADGRVAVAERKGGYGNCIDIDHGYNYTSRYAHLSSMSVAPGQTVKRGDMIGRVGSTGHSSGPHLHYEVRYRDVAENPVNYSFAEMDADRYEKMLELSENAGHMMD